jgi:hypothetical protein
MYQGLTLPNFLLVALSEKVSFLFGNWCFSGQAHSDALAMAYNNFFVEVGLNGSPLDWGYDNYSNLATKAMWFYNLWIHVHKFNVAFTFSAKDRVHGSLRENNCSLMLEFFHVGYCSKDLILLNIVKVLKHPPSL